MSGQAPDSPRMHIAPDWNHLLRMTDDCGLLEHATGAVPNRTHGYCTDDNGRALGVVSIANDPSLGTLAERYLAFVEHAYLDDGHFALRMNYGRTWLDATSDDASGRAIFGLGTAAAHAPWRTVREGARALFDRAAAFRSPFPRAMAYAALGAIEIARHDPGHRRAHDLLRAAADVLGDVPESAEWPWEEPRLTYANALIPAARLAIAELRHDPEPTHEALRQLDWLSQLQRGPECLSIVPHSGYGSSDGPLPAYDQQPIEVWHLADAAARAWAATREEQWSALVVACARWFEGDNDLGTVMFDPNSGGGFDGLGARGPNRNQGAESTLARIAVGLIADRVANEAGQPAEASRWPRT